MTCEISLKTCLIVASVLSLGMGLSGYILGKRSGLLEGWRRGIRSGYESAMKNKIL
jgi:hypothetical protein